MLLNVIRDRLSIAQDLEESSLSTDCIALRFPQASQFMPVNIKGLVVFSRMLDENQRLNSSHHLVCMVETGNRALNNIGKSFQTCFSFA